MTRTHWASIAAVVLALLFAGTATVVAGEDDGPAGPATPDAASADAGFARDMSVHHQQAVEMSFIVRDRTQNEEIRSLAYDIANTQANQRGMMMGWLDLWGLPKVAPGEAPMAWMAKAGGAHAGHGTKDAASANSSGDADTAPMPGMATQAQLERLGELSGRAAEIEYLQLMIVHHNGGVDMAQGCVDLCTVDTEKSLAQGMVNAQRSEVELMVDLLKKRGAQVRT
ncbi:DUF305 domain-containing protein [Streptomyces yaizuensis]|uniref:DUF305 domain-containing protein n=2 Tax=Streptomyces yaizuensis TaxID=2989713 RepID=A0ABQ5NUF3_9ACTN|nr:DUF305 domain-containing protein [Streptomyces sp. YSPA8]